MPAEFTIKANDTLPQIAANLSYADGSLPNLIGASVQFVMGKAGTPPKIEAPATVVDTETALVAYDWSGAGDTDTPGLDWLAEWEVTFPGGGKQTFPSDAYHSIAIVPDLDVN